MYKWLVINKMRLIILSLGLHNDKVYLNYNLTSKLLSWNNHHSNTLEIDLPSGKIRLNKWEYLNKWKVYQDFKQPEIFFVIASYKKPCRKYALKFLLNFRDRLKEVA